MNTGEMLDALAVIGKPQVCRFDRGWHAVVTLPTPQGVSAEIRSDFNHPTHESALTQLLARCDALTAKPVAPPRAAGLIDGDTDTREAQEK